MSCSCGSCSSKEQKQVDVPEPCEVVITHRNRPNIQRVVETKTCPHLAGNSVIIDIGKENQNTVDSLRSGLLDLYVDGTEFVVTSVQYQPLLDSCRYVILVDRSSSTNNRIAYKGENTHIYDIFNDVLNSFRQSTPQMEVYFFPVQEKNPAQMRHISRKHVISNDDDLRTAISDNSNLYNNSPILKAINEVEEIYRNRDQKTHFIILTDGIYSDSRDNILPELNRSNITYHLFLGVPKRKSNDHRIKVLKAFVENSNGVFTSDWSELDAFIKEVNRRASATHKLYAKPKAMLTVDPDTVVFKNIAISYQERPLISRIYFDDYGQAEISDNVFNSRYQRYFEEYIERLRANPDIAFVLDGHMWTAEFDSDTLHDLRM